MILVETAAGPSKAALRAWVRARRSECSSLDRERASTAIARAAATLLPPGAATRVAAHLALPTEPPTDALIAALHDAGLRVLVPRVVGDALEWVAWHPGVELRRGRFGIAEPVGDADPRGLAGVVAILVPALAVDRTGHRLGQGGGYYDRTLATVPAHAAGGPLRVAVVYDDEVLDEVPYEPHDITVDGVLTPSGLVRLG